jgi:23S rRNA pseudoU1915 N3-methylase RlmH
MGDSKDLTRFANAVRALVNNPEFERINIAKLLARPLVPLAIQRIEDVLKDPEGMDPKVAKLVLQAAQIVMERAYGKPSVVLEVDDGTEFDHEDLARQIEEARKIGEKVINMIHGEVNEEKEQSS